MVQHPGATQSMAMPASMPSLSQAYADQKRKNATIATVIGVCALAAAMIVGLTQGAKALGFGADRQKAEVLGAPGATSSAVLMAPGNSGPPVMTSEAKLPEKMPKEIFDWLEHLRKCEEERISITSGQGSKLMVEKAKGQIAGGVDAVKDLLNGIDDPNSEIHPPTEGLAKLIKQMHDETMNLVQYFNSVPPPEECIPIRDAYDRTIRETAGQIGDVADSLAASDINGLLSMKGKSNEGIDANGKKTDRLVGEICDKYHTSKWFSINGDITFGGVFSAGPGF
jgi:hypothetical protein